MLDPNSRYVVISADGHVGPKIEAYRDYCPKKYLTVFDEQIEGFAPLVETIPACWIWARSL